MRTGKGNGTLAPCACRGSCSEQTRHNRGRARRGEGGRKLKFGRHGRSRNFVRRVGYKNVLKTMKDESEVV